jgi:small subunit ribosomal protein S4e
VVRDYLSLARNSREADRIIFDGGVLVDGRARKEPRFGVGLMDVVCVPSLGRSYRVLLDSRGRLVFNEISGEESSVKLCRVNRKQILRGGKIQLTLHDGKNLTGELGGFKPGDVVKLALPDLEIIERLPMEGGALAFITGGKNTSRVGRIEEIKVTRGPQPNMVALRSGDEILEAPQDYVFVVGREKPEISIPGVET